MVETQTTEEVLRQIEDGLRQDERLLRSMERDLRALGVRPPRRAGRIAAIVVAAALALSGAFALGWFAAPTSTVAVPPSTMEMLDTNARESFAAPAWYGVHAPSPPAR